MLIATRNGAATVAETIASVRDQADVFVVSDGSTDDTAAVARAAGAHVIELAENVGKPGALFRALFALELPRRYEAVAILDDDTVVAPDFMEQAMRKMADGVAIVVGRTQTRWDRARRWNPWLHSRAYAYFRYQLTMRRGQSALNALNCISGSNSVYRSSVLDQIVTAHTPYIVDDTFWTLETHRRGLGRIVYAPDAHAWVQDPTCLRDWYRQNLRWLWGTFQGIRGHRIGTRRTMLDATCLLQIADWFLYVFGGPAAVALLIGMSLPVELLLAGWVAGYGAWLAVAAVALRQWRLPLMLPAIVVADWIYRIVFIHAAVKTMRVPRVESCRWESPQRYGAELATEGGAA